MCLDRGVILPVLPCRLPQLITQNLAGQWLVSQGAQDIEAHHIARPFPDRIQRCFAVQKRQAAVLHIARPTQGLHRLINQARSQLVAQKLGQRHAEPGKGTVALGSAIKGTRHMQSQRQCAFPIQGQIGQNSAHQRLVNQPCVKGTAVARPVMRPIQGRAHQPGRGQRRIQPRVVHHVDDGADALAFLAQRIRQRIDIVDLG